MHARAIQALELDRSKLESQIEGERVSTQFHILVADSIVVVYTELQTNLQNLQLDLKFAQKKNTELRQKVVRYRTEREEKQKEVAAAVQELENVRRERAKDLKSFQEKEAELMAEVERQCKTSKGKARECDSFNRSVEEADKEKEPRDELETLKVRHFLCCVQLA